MAARQRPAKQETVAWQVPAVENAAMPSRIAVVGMDARFGPWQSLRSFQERVLGGDSRYATPAPPNSWWGARKVAWFRGEGLGKTPFRGYYLDEVARAADQFRIPPREMEEMLPQQLLMLQTAAAAMADAGLDRDGQPATPGSSSASPST